MYSQEDTIANQINDLKAKYYNKNGTSILFKNTQKRDCAVDIVNHIPINTLLKETIYIVENTNHIYIKYEILKSFAAPAVYSIIINHIIYPSNVPRLSYIYFDPFHNYLEISVRVAKEKLCQ